ncbi:MAG: ankyrin repeat domain-containing protein [Gammaproteobacteria bacterium]
MKPTLRFFAPIVLAASILLPACGGGDGGGFDITQQPFTREREDGKIPVKPELIRQQVRAVWDGTPEGEAEVLRWQQIETDYHACRLASDKTKKTTEKVFADCMAGRGYVYMYRIDAEQLHNDIEFEMDKNREKIFAAERKAEAERLAAERKRQEKAEIRRRQKELGDALVNALSALDDINLPEIKGLIDDGADINTKGESGMTALHFASIRGHTETVLAFIKAGADINAKLKNGRTALHMAAFSGRTKTALALVKAGADIDAKDNGGSTPLHSTTNEGQLETALALVKAGANIDTKDNDGWTPLYRAIGNRQTEVAIAFIKAGADIKAKDSDGYTPLHIAAANGESEIARALIKAGADIDAKQNDGFTPLHIAAIYGNTEFTFALVKAGANLYALSDNEQTALDIAIIKYGKDSEIVYFLQGAMEKHRNKDRQKADKLLRELE